MNGFYITESRSKRFVQSVHLTVSPKKEALISSMENALINGRRQENMRKNEKSTRELTLAITY